VTRRATVSEILRFLGLERSTLLDELREEGLFEEELLDAERAEELRVATCLMRELGVNPAGVDVALHMRRRMLTLEARMQRSLQRLLDEVE
jgi:hypothetical protein